MVDVLADRGAEEEALCCVCGGGDSSKEAGNEIVFCERCDMAVHQKCYRVDTIPAGQSEAPKPSPLQSQFFTSKSRKCRDPKNWK